MSFSCYVTGQTEALQPYYFGSPEHVRLGLTEPAFAVFIIRAGEDEHHQRILADIKACIEDATTLAQDVKSADINTDEAIEAGLAMAEASDKLTLLLTKKAKSGVRILRQMKKDYEAGKLPI